MHNGREHTKRKNYENLERAISKGEEIAKKQFKDKVLKSKGVNKLKKKILKKTPITLKMLGAAAAIVMRKKAIEAKKTFNLDKTGDTSITLEGSYNPWTKEKRGAILFNKSF